MDEFQVLTPEGEVYKVPAQNLQTALSDLGGFLLDSGAYPNLVMGDGNVASSGMREAVGSLTSGSAKLVKMQHVKMLDPNGETRKVPLENINVAFENGFQMIRKAPVDVKTSEPEQPDVAGLEQKTWIDALRDVGNNPVSYIPFLNAVDVLKSWDVYSIARRKQNGEKLTSQEDEYLNAYLTDQSRPQSWGYKALHTTLASIPFMFEFLGTGALIKGAAKKAATVGGKLAVSSADDLAKPVIKEVVENAATRGFSMDAMKKAAAKGVGTTLDDVLEAGARNGDEALLKKVTGELMDGTRVPVRAGLDDVISQAYATANIADASPMTKLAQAALRDDMGEFGEAVKLWGENFWQRAGTLTAEQTAAKGTEAAAAFGRQIVKAGLEAIGPRAILQTHRILDQTNQNRLEAVLTNENDDFWPAFRKAYMDNVIENFSEQTGEGLLFLSGAFGPGSKMAAPFRNAMTDKAIDWFTKNKFAGDASAAFRYLFGETDGLLRRAGWNGVIGEMAEEGVGAVLRMGTGLVEPGLPSFSDVTAMAVGFAINPVAGVATIQDMRGRKLRKAIDEISQARKEAADNLQGSLAGSAADVQKLKEVLKTRATEAYPDLQEAQADARAPIARFLSNLSQWATGQKAANKSVAAYLDQLDEQGIQAIISNPKAPRATEDDWNRWAMTAAGGVVVTKNEAQAEIAKALQHDAVPYEQLSDVQKAALGARSVQVDPVTGEITRLNTYDIRKAREQAKGAGLEVTTREGGTRTVTAAELDEFVKDNPTIIFDGIDYGVPQGVGKRHTSTNSYISSVLGEETVDAKNLSDEQVVKLARITGQNGTRGELRNWVSNYVRLLDAAVKNSGGIQQLSGKANVLSDADYARIGYLAPKQGALRISRDELLKSNVVNNPNDIPADGKYFYFNDIHVASSADGKTLLINPRGLASLGSISEDTWEAVAKKDGGAGYEAMRDGYDELRTRVMQIAVPKDITPSDADYYQAISELKELFADDNPNDSTVLEAFSKYTVALQGYSQKEMNMRMPSGMISTRREPGYGTSSQRRFAQAKLTEEVPQAYKRLYLGREQLLADTSPNGDFSLANVKTYTPTGPEAVAAEINRAAQYGVELKVTPEGKYTGTLIKPGKLEELGPLVVRAKAWKALRPDFEVNIDAEAKRLRAEMEAEIGEAAAKRFEELLQEQLPGAVYQDGVVQVPEALTVEELEAFKAGRDVIVNVIATEFNEDVSYRFPTDEALAAAIQDTEEQKRQAELAQVQEELAGYDTAGKFKRAKKADLQRMLKVLDPTADLTGTKDQLISQLQKFSPHEHIRNMGVEPAAPTPPASEPPTVAKDKNYLDGLNLSMEPRPAVLVDDAGNLGKGKNRVARLQEQIISDKTLSQRAVERITKYLAASDDLDRTSESRIARIQAQAQQRTKLWNVLSEVYKDSASPEVAEELIKRAKVRFGFTEGADLVDDDDFSQYDADREMLNDKELNKNLKAFLMREIVRSKLGLITTERGGMANYTYDEVDQLLTKVFAGLFPRTKTEWEAQMDRFMPKGWRDLPEIKAFMDNEAARLTDATSNGYMYIPFYDTISPVFYSDPGFAEFLKLPKAFNTNEEIADGVVKQFAAAFKRTGLLEIAQFFRNRTTVNAFDASGIKNSTVSAARVRDEILRNAAATDWPKPDTKVRGLRSIYALVYGKVPPEEGGELPASSMWGGPNTLRGRLASPDMAVRMEAAEALVFVVNEWANANGKLALRLGDSIRRAAHFGDTSEILRLARGLENFFFIRKDRDGNPDVPYALSEFAKIDVRNAHMSGVFRLIAQYETLARRRVPVSGVDSRTSYIGVEGTRKPAFHEGDLATRAAVEYISQRPDKENWFLVDLDLSKKATPDERVARLNELYNKYGIAVAPFAMGEHVTTRGIGYIMPMDSKESLDEFRERVGMEILGAVLPGIKIAQVPKRSTQTTSSGRSATASSGAVNPLIHVISMNDTELDPYLQEYFKSTGMTAEEAKKAATVALSDGGFATDSRGMQSISQAFGLPHEDWSNAVKMLIMAPKNMIKQHTIGISKAQQEENPVLKRMVDIIAAYKEQNGLGENDLVLVGSQEAVKMAQSKRSEGEKPTTVKLFNSSEIPDAIDSAVMPLSSMMFMSDEDHTKSRTQIQRLQDITHDLFPDYAQDIVRIAENAATVGEFYSGVMDLWSTGAWGESVKDFERRLALLKTGRKDASAQSIFEQPTLGVPSFDALQPAVERLTTTIDQTINDFSQIKKDVTELKSLRNEIASFYEKTVNAQVTGALLRPKNVRLIKSKKILKQPLFRLMAKVQNETSLQLATIVNAETQKRLANLDLTVGFLYAQESLEFPSEEERARFLESLDVATPLTLKELRERAVNHKATNAADLDEAFMSRIIAQIAEEDPDAAARLRMNPGDITSDPVDLGRMFLKSSNALQRALKMDRYGAGFVAKPSYRIQTVDEQKESLILGEPVVATGDYSTPGKTVFGIAVGDLGDFSGVRYMERTNRVDDIAAWVLTKNFETNGKYADLITGNANPVAEETVESYITRLRDRVRTWEIEHWSNENTMIVPGSFLDINRIPSTNGSQIALRLGYRPADTTNELQIPHFEMYRSGADYDVDKWYTFLFSGRNLKASSRMYASDDYIRKLVEIYDTPEGQAFLRDDYIDMSWFESTYNMNTFREGEKVFDDAGIKKMSEIGQMPKTVLGPSVFSSSALAGAQAYGLYSLPPLARWVDAYRPEDQNGVAASGVLDTIYSPRMDQWRTAGIQKRRESTALVDRVWNDYVNKIVDNAKEPRVAEIGLDAQTGKAVLTLLHGELFETREEVLQEFYRLGEIFALKAYDKVDETGKLVIDPLEAMADKSIILELASTLGADAGRINILVGDFKIESVTLSDLRELSDLFSGMRGKDRFKLLSVDRPKLDQVPLFQRNKATYNKAVEMFFNNPMLGNQLITTGTSRRDNNSGMTRPFTRLFIGTMQAMFNLDPSPFFAVREYAESEGEESLLSTAKELIGNNYRLIIPTALDDTQVAKSVSGLMFLQKLGGENLQGLIQESIDRRLAAAKDPAQVRVAGTAADTIFTTYPQLVAANPFLRHLDVRPQPSGNFLWEFDSAYTGEILTDGLKKQIHDDFMKMPVEARQAFLMLAYNMAPVQAVGSGRLMELIPTDWEVAQRKLVYQKINERLVNLPQAELDVLVHGINTQANNIVGLSDKPMLTPPILDIAGQDQATAGFVMGAPGVNRWQRQFSGGQNVTPVAPGLSPVAAQLKKFAEAKAKLVGETVTVDFEGNTFPATVKDVAFEPSAKVIWNDGTEVVKSYIGLVYLKSVRSGKEFPTQPINVRSANKELDTLIKGLENYMEVDVSYSLEEAAPFLEIEISDVPDNTIAQLKERGTPLAHKFIRQLKDDALLDYSLELFVEQNYIDPKTDTIVYSTPITNTFVESDTLFQKIASLRQGILGASQLDKAHLSEIYTRLGLKTTPDDRLYRYEGGKADMTSVFKAAAEAVFKKKSVYIEGLKAGDPFTTEDKGQVEEMLWGVATMMNNIDDATSWDQALDVPIAIKELPVGFEVSRRMREDGISQADAIQQLKNENKLGTLDVVARDGQLYGVVYLTPRETFKKWGESAAYAKLSAEEAGRNKEKLTPKYLVKELTEILERYPQKILDISAKYGKPYQIGIFDHYFPLIYSEHGLYTPEETAAYDKAMREILGRSDGTKQGALEISEALADLPEGRRPDPTELQLQYLTKLRGILGIAEEDYNPPRDRVEAQIQLNTLFAKAVVRMDPKMWSTDMANAFAQVRNQQKILIKKNIKYRTTSDRFKHRWNKNYQSAYEKQGLLPKNLNPLEVVSSYINETLTAAAQSAAIQTAALSRSMIDGAPLVVFIPNEEQLEAASWLVPPAVIEQNARWLAEHVGVKYMPNKTPLANLKDMTTYLQNPKSGYGLVTNPGFKQFELIFAKKGNGFNGYGPSAFAAMQHLFSKPVSRPWPKSIQNVFRHVHDMLNLPDEKDGTTAAERIAERDMMDDIMGFTQLTKFMNLAFSIFFGNSALESFVASQGLGGFKRGLKDPKAAWEYYKEMRREILTGDIGDPSLREKLERLVMNGMSFDIQYNVNQNIDLGYPERLIERMERHGGKWARPFVSVLKRQLAFSEWMFGDLFPVLKTISAINLAEETEKTKGSALSDEDYAAIAKVMDDGFGGQNWKSFWWANPKVMQIMNLLFRAPNWSLSSFRIGGGNVLLDKAGLGPRVSQLEKDFQTHKYWPAMISLVLLGWPNAIQLAMYAAFGDPDKDKPLTFQNEKGKERHVDITPMLRTLPWYKGDPSGERRFYMRWGKQVYEVWDTDNSWVSDVWNLKPTRTFLRKMSTPVQMVYAMVTGSAPGVDGWAYDFKDAGLLGLVSGEKEGFTGSRLAIAGQMLLPYSLSSLTTGREKLPFSVFGSVSKGVTQYELGETMERVMRTYANDASWKEIQNSERGKRDLKALSLAVVEAAQANGYEVDTIVRTGRSNVLRDLYADFLEALDRQDKGKMESLAASILRLNGTADSLERSYKTKQGRYVDKPDLTPEQYQLIYDAFGGKENIP